MYLEGVRGKDCETREPNALFSSSFGWFLFGFPFDLEFQAEGLAHQSGLFETTTFLFQTFKINHFLSQETSHVAFIKRKQKQQHPEKRAALNILNTKKKDARK